MINSDLNLRIVFDGMNISRVHAPVVGDATLTWATREGSSGKLALYYDETSYQTATTYQVRVWHKGHMIVGVHAWVSDMPAGHGL